MITFNGKPVVLLDDDGRMDALLARRFQVSDAEIFGQRASALANQRRETDHDFVELRVPNWPAPPSMPINSLYWPTGATRWGCGLFLVTGAFVDELFEAFAEGQGTAANLIISNPADAEGIQEITAAMSVLPPVPLFEMQYAGDPPEDFRERRPYLLPLVDQRYFWQGRHVGEWEGDLTDATTWSELWDLITAALGVEEIDADAFDADYFLPDYTTFSRLGCESAAALADAVAFSCGMRIAVDFDGKLYLNNFESTETTYQANIAIGDLVAGGELSATHVKAAYPSAVETVFRTATDGILQKETSVLSKEASDEGFESLQADHPKRIYSTLASRLDCDGVLQNNADQQTLAQKIADDYYASHRRKFNYTFAGVKNWKTEGYTDHVLVQYGVMHAGQRVAQTTVRSLPFDFGPDQQLSQKDFDPIVAETALGKFTSTLVRRASGVCTRATADVWEINGSNTLADSGKNLCVFNPNGLPIIAGDLAKFSKTSNGKWIVSELLGAMRNFHFRSQLSSAGLVINTALLSTGLTGGTVWAGSNLLPVYWSSPTVLVQFPGYYHVQAVLNVQSNFAQPADNIHHYAKILFSADLAGGSLSAGGYVTFIYPAKETDTGVDSNGDTDFTHTFTGIVTPVHQCVINAIVTKVGTTAQALNIRPTAITASVGGPAIGDFTVISPSHIEVRPIGYGDVLGAWVF